VYLTGITTTNAPNRKKMSNNTFHDEDPINIKEEDSDDGGVAFLAKAAARMGIKAFVKNAKSFEDKREDEKVRWPGSDEEDDSDDDETGGIATLAAKMAAAKRNN
jgi:hypothetical protein